MKNLLRNMAYASVILAAVSVVLHEMGGTAGAQSGGSQVVAATGDAYLASVYMANGDVYLVTHQQTGPSTFAFTSQLRGNVFTGAGPTPTATKSWGSLKSGH